MAQAMISGNRVTVLCVLAVTILCICSPSSADTTVLFDTAMGSFQVQLSDTVTPETVQNFLNYVNDGDYVNSFFHRMAWLEDQYGNPTTPFVLQGGGFTYDLPLDQFGLVPTDDPVVNEFNVSNIRGTIVMAKTAAGPDSATSQFFFNLGDNSANLDNQNGGFTVFGEVLGNGMDIVDLLAAQEVWDASGVHPAWTDLPLINYSGSGPWPPTLEMVYSITVVGDVDGDGYVGGTDLTGTITNWGMTGASRIDGDLNGDGTVSGPDYTEVITYWGTGSPPEPPSTIPEPATMALLLIGGLAALLRRPR